MFVKRIYRAQRNSSLDESGFRDAWRNHAALAMSKPRWKNIVRYVHCDPLRDVVSVPDLACEYDGVALIWYRSRTARLEHVADATSQRFMEEDEMGVFKELVKNFATVTEEVVLRDGPTNGPKLISFLKRGNVDMVDFNSYWRDDYAYSLLQATIGDVIRYVQNWPIDPEVGDHWGLDCDLIEEFWFSDIASMIAFHSRADFDRLVGKPRRTVAGEVKVIAAVETPLFEFFDRSSN